MKFWFFAVVLANVIFLLWEMQHRAVETVAEQNSKASVKKQILLLSELTEQPTLATKLAPVGPDAANSEQRPPHGGDIDQPLTVALPFDANNDQHLPQPIRHEVAVKKEPPVQETPLPQSQQAEAKTVEKVSSLAMVENETEVSIHEQTNEQAAATKSALSENQIDSSLIETQASITTTAVREEESVAAGEHGDEQAENVLQIELQTSDATGLENPKPTKPEILSKVSGTEQTPSQGLPVAEQTEETKEEAAQEVAMEQAEGSEQNLKETAPQFPVCYEIGPFANKRQMHAWIKQQQLENKHTKPVYKIQQVARSFLVYYPAGETFIASKQNEAMLKEKGISDLWLFRKGKMKGMISLGLFREKFRAEKLLRQLAEIEVVAEIKERYEDEEALYVRISQPMTSEQPKSLMVSDCAEISSGVDN